MRTRFDRLNELETELRYLVESFPQCRGYDRDRLVASAREERRREIRRLRHRIWKLRESLGVPSWSTILRLENELWEAMDAAQLCTNEFQRRAWHREIERRRTDLFALVDQLEQLERGVYVPRVESDTEQQQLAAPEAQERRAAAEELMQAVAALLGSERVEIIEEGEEINDEREEDIPEVARSGSLGPAAAVREGGADAARGRARRARCEDRPGARPGDRARGLGRGEGSATDPSGRAGASGRRAGPSAGGSPDCGGATAVTAGEAAGAGGDAPGPTWR